jgi:2-oxo-4-hydroxy-4-carboxy--5-ureidoimidazoline (OHCU) decarboxylase/GNAT superfamily N-acetyltransferase
MSSATHAAEIQVRDLGPADHEWARALIARYQGGTDRVARLGEMVDPLAMEGLVAEADGRPVGLAAVHEAPGKGLEVVMLVSEPSGAGAGTALMETARQVATASRHGRLWLVTTNDNVGAIHFYLRRGMRVAAVHAGAVEADRALKPEIPVVNPVSGIPIRDLVEMELTGDDLAQPLSTVEYPRAEDLDRLPVEAFVSEVAPLFEGGGRFLERLAETRPLQNEDGLLVAAFEVAHGLPEDEQIELVEQHPRIGSEAAEMSEHSFAEQGYAQDADLTAEELAEERAVAEREAKRVHEELAMLNELYEQRFGFRYVVFVAGRPRSGIVPLIERALRNDRDAELRRAVDETIYIAGDRLRRLRGLGTEV